MSSIPWMRVLACWLALAVLMSANGVFRELVLKPSLGATAADVLSAVLGAAIILLLTAYAFRALAGTSIGGLLAVSVALVALTVGFELVVGRFVDHRSWAELAGNYALWRGRLWPLLLAIVAVSPLLWGRWMRAEAG